MRRRFVMALLAFGAVLGFGSELAHAHCRQWQAHRQTMMDAWAESCVHAAQSAPAQPTR